MFVSMVTTSFFLLCNVIQVLTFNLDTSNVNIFKGQPESRSGYAVATWKMNYHDHYGVVFGAPHWRPRHTKHQKVAKTGSIYYCSWNNTNCNILESVNEIKKSGGSVEALDLVKNVESFSIGFGETIYSSISSPSLLTCAPRYLYKESYIDTYYRKFYKITARGACYYFQDEFSEYRTILPLDHRSYYRQGEENVMPSALAGTSALITEDDTVYMGAPSLFYGVGVTITTPLSIKGRYKQSKNHHVQNENELLYEGMSMAKGKFNGQWEMVAVSRPGAVNQNSKVIFYRNAFVKYSVPIRRGISMTDKQMNSKFGFSMTSGDFDADGCDDLVVSAPFSSVRMQSAFAKKSMETEAGKVYIFYSPLDKVNVHPDTLVLDGYTRRGLFGYSVFCPGDLNRDGIADLIVGAPRDGRGVIFVYNGSPTGLIRKPTQIIEALDVAGHGGLPTGFGFSVAGGHDVDANGYPDIAVGAIKSDSAVLLRTAPVLNLAGEIYFNKSGKNFLGGSKCSIKLKNGQMAETNCFDLTIQIQYSSYGLQNKIPVVLLVTLDQKHKASSRLFFRADHSRWFEFQRNITNVENKIKPFKLHVYLKPGLKTEQLKDVIYTTVAVKLPPKHVVSAALPPPFGSQPESMNILPILNALSKVHEFSSTERMICENEDKCFPKPDLSVSVRGNDSFVIGDEKVKMVIILVSKMADSYQVMLSVKKHSGFHISEVVFDRKFAHSFDVNDCKISMRQEYSDVTCKIADELALEKEMVVTITFEQTPSTITNAVISDFLENFNFIFSLTSDNTDRNDNNNIASISMKPLLKSELYLSSLAIPETTVAWSNYSQDVEEKFLKLSKLDENVVKKFNQSESLGTTLTHRFIITNEGPSPMPWYKATLTVPVAYGMKEMVHLAVISPLEVSGRNFTCDRVDSKFSMQKYISPHMETANDTINRKERSLSHDEMDESRVRTLALECGKNKRVKCVTINCQSNLLLIGSEDRLEFKVVIPSFFVNKLGRNNFTFVSTLDVFTSSGKDYTIESVTSVDVQSPRTLMDFLYEQLILILGTVVCGVLIILVITFILYKVGYFKRAKRDQLLTERKEYRKSMMLMKQPSEMDDNFAFNASVQPMQRNL